MSRDYKNAGRGKLRRRPVPGWLWLLAGLAIGLFAAFSMIHLHGRTPSAQAAAQPTQTLQAPPPVNDTLHDTRDVRKKPAPALPPPPKPKFDFYTILPEMEVTVPEQDITGTPKQGLPQVNAPGTYVLQAGSFRTSQQADRLKARLIRLGIQAHVQTVTLANGETWHRVQIGPYTDLNRLNNTRARLRQNHINAVLLRLKS